MEDGQTLRTDVLSMRTPQGWNTDLLFDEAWKNKLHRDIVEVFRRNPADQLFSPTPTQVMANLSATSTSTSTSTSASPSSSASNPLLRKLLAIPPPNIIVPTFIPPPTKPSIKKYVQIHVGKLHPATIQHIKSQREQLRKQQSETEYPTHHSTDVAPVDLRQNSSTTEHKPQSMYKVILPTWYNASTPPGGQPNLPTGQWYPHPGAAPATTTSTSSPEAPASHSFTATIAVPEATASPSASATTVAAPNTVTVVTATEPSENSTPKTASTAAMEIDSEPADFTPAATPLA